MCFCLCGSLECICEGRCVCAHRYCLCISCHDLRRKEWCKVCGLPSSFRELSASTTAASICKCDSLIRVNTKVLQRFPNLNISTEALTEDTHVSELPREENGSKTRNLFEASSNHTVRPMEQEMMNLLDFDTAQTLSNRKVGNEDLSKFPVDNTEEYVYPPITEESSDSKVSSPEFATIKESSTFSLYDSLMQEKQEAVSVTEQIMLSTDDDQSLTKERIKLKQSTDFSPDSYKSRHSKISSSLSEFSDYSILEMPENKWNSEFSIIEMPESDPNSCSRASLNLIYDLRATMSKARSSSLISERTDNVHHHFASLPSFHTSFSPFINRPIPPVQRSVLSLESAQLNLLPHLPMSRNTINDPTKSSSVSTVDESPERTILDSSNTINLSEPRNTPPSVETAEQLSQKLTLSESAKVVAKSSRNNDEMFPADDVELFFSQFQEDYFL